MNIFTHETSIVGDVEMAVKLEDTSRNFWKQAEVIRKKLGNRKYLLDEYLASLFEAVSLTQIDNVTTISKAVNICFTVIGRSNTPEGIFVNILLPACPLPAACLSEQLQFVLRRLNH